MQLSKNDIKEMLQDLERVIQELEGQKQELIILLKEKENDQAAAQSDF